MELSFGQVCATAAKTTPVHVDSIIFTITSMLKRLCKMVGVDAYSMYPGDNSDLTILGYKDGILGW